MGSLPNEKPETAGARSLKTNRTRPAPLPALPDPAPQVIQEASRLISGVPSARKARPPSVTSSSFSSPGAAQELSCGSPRPITVPHRDVLIAAAVSPLAPNEVQRLQPSVLSPGLDSTAPGRVCPVEE